MQIQLFHSEYNAASRAVRDALGAAATVVDIHDSASQAAVQAAGVSAIPCVVVKHDNGTDFARFEGEQVDPAEIAALLLAPVGPLVQVARVQPVAGNPFRVSAKDEAGTLADPVSLVIDGAAPIQPDLIEQVDSGEVDAQGNAIFTEQRTPAVFAAGEATFDLEFAAAGTYKVAVNGGPAIVFDVAEAEAPEPEPEPAV